MGKLNYVKGKTRQEKFDYFNSLQYDILLRRKNGIFYLIISELPLVVANENLENAYKDLCEEKQRLINKMLDCDAEDEIVIPHKTFETNRIFQQLKPFICKLLIVCFLFGTPLIFGGIVIKNRIEDISVRDIAKKAVDSIIVESQKIFNAPEDIRQRRIEKMRKVLEVIHFVVDEYKSMSPSSNAGEKSKSKL